jgi:1-acyl-sn-glycerol-3-phosphate acyltransferase/DNA-directed RNA polymerase subunit RPC12/RpoP
MTTAKDTGLGWAAASVVSIVVVAALLVGSAQLFDQRWHAAFRPEPWLRGVGAVTAMGSTGMLAVAAVQYRRARALGSELFERGLFGFWRHPVHLFFVLLIAGLGLGFGSGTMLGGVLPISVLGAVSLAARQERRQKNALPVLYPGHRRRTGLLWPRLVWWLRPWAWLVAKALFRFRVRHRDRLPASGRYVVLAAHRSCLDLLWVSLAIPHAVRFVASFDLFRRPAAGWLLGRCFALRSQRRAAEMPRTRDLVRAVEEGWVVVLFPEAEPSWTGELGPLRPEMLRLVQRLKVPVVPLRMDGTGLVWPRWRDRPGRAPVRITVQEPLSFGFVDSLGLVGNRLAALLRPHETALRSLGTPNAAGIGRLLYRCPTCRKRWPLLRAARTTIDCPKCHVRFVFTPEHQLRFLQEDRSLDELYRVIRLTRSDLPRLARTRCPFERVSLREREAYLDHAEASFAEETSQRRTRASRGTLLLTTERLLLCTDESPNDWPLATVDSVTVEGRDELWIQQTTDPGILRLSLLGRSALYWRDLVTLAVANAARGTPSRG